jgi:hypothetical protein
MKWSGVSAGPGLLPARRPVFARTAAACNPMTGENMEEDFGREEKKKTLECYAGSATRRESKGRH